MRRKKPSVSIYYTISRPRHRIRLLMFCILLAIIAGLLAGGLAYICYKDSSGISNQERRNYGLEQEKQRILLGAAEIHGLEAKDSPDDIGENYSADTQSGKMTASNSLDVVKIERATRKVKGIYVPVDKINNEEKLNRMIKLLDETELNAVVIDVKDDFGRLSYTSELDIAVSIGASNHKIKDLAGIITKLKEHDVYCIARIVAFKDPFLASHRRDLAIKNQDGTIYLDNNECWINPYEREVWDYLVDIGIEAGLLGFDEIQYDYIRFSTGSGMDKVVFGNDSETRSKENVIIDFTRYAYVNLKAEGLFVSADVYGTIISSSVDAGLTGQNYLEMSKHLDYICPMIYPSHFGKGNYGVEFPDLFPGEIVRKVLAASYNKIASIGEDENRAVVRPWLQDFTASWLANSQTYTSVQVREQIDAVYEAGYDEWFLWNGAANYTRGGLLEE